MPHYQVCLTRPARDLPDRVRRELAVVGEPAPEGGETTFVEVEAVSSRDAVAMVRAGLEAGQRIGWVQAVD